MNRHRIHNFRPRPAPFDEAKFITQNPHFNGFTLIEVLLSIVLIATLAAISVPVYQSFQTRNDLDIAATTVTQSLRRAQVLSQAVERDSSWGLKVTDENITIFKGTSFDARDSGFDESFDLPKSVELDQDALTEVVFSKLQGLPQESGTITLISTANEKRDITINQKGTVEY